MGHGEERKLKTRAKVRRERDEDARKRGGGKEMKTRGSGAEGKR